MASTKPAMVTQTGDTHYRQHSTPYTGICLPRSSFRYRDAGVNIDEADRAVSSIKKSGAADVYARSADRYRQLRGDVPTGGVSQAGAGELGRRRGHEVEGRVPDGPSRHGGRRPGEPLRERHRGAGRDAAVLPGLLRGGEAGCGRRGGRGWRDCARVQEERLRADRRRDGGDAGLVRGRANTTWRASSWARRNAASC